ncbi:MAG: tetratricopeptide repeat protein [Bacteroidota bacterium]
MPRYWLLLAFLVPLFGAPSTAQAQRVDSLLVAKYRLAESYVRAGQFDRGINLLEDLYETSPSTYAFYDKLKEAYENVKRYDDAIALVGDRLERGPDPVLMAEQGRLHYLANREAEADSAWARALRVDTTNQHAYRTVYQSLFQVRLFERSISVLEQGRRAVGDTTLFQNDLASLYNLTGRHREAMVEYLAVLSTDPRRLSYVRSRLTRFVEQEEALALSIGAVEQAIRREPLNRAYRELASWLYLEAEAYEEAFDVNRAIDRLEQENGRVLFAFAQQAADADAYDVALQAYDEILTRYPEAPSAAEALLGLAEMHQRWAEHLGERPLNEEGERQPATHYDAALDAYQTFLTRHPTHPTYPLVLQRLGHLQQTVFFDLDAAEDILQEVVTRFPRSGAMDEAAYGLGRIALLRGDLDRARRALSQLEASLRTGELAEKARYELALIHLYRGEWNAARTLANVMEENTSTDVANDAIELKVLLIENKGTDSLNVPLQRFAEAQLRLRQRRPLQALAVLDSLGAQLGQHTLADDVAFLRGTILRDIGRTDEALATFGELPLAYPRSFLGDRSLFQYAEILEFERQDPEGAIEAYTRLLDTYPGSLLATEARLRIRVLRGDSS